ncbi:MAG: hypothetical protein IMY85_00125 [Chloroflexi bacterium]|nr:hypothetical protein [Chloroflexota bacterium]
MKLTKPSLIITSILVFIIIVAYSTTPAVGRELKAGVSIPDGSIEQRQSIRINQQVTATITIIINLPIIEQNVPTETPIPLNGDSQAGSETELYTGTPTPTPIPVQTGSVNLPIVIGALAIMLVIILAWFFVGYLPATNKE